MKMRKLFAVVAAAATLIGGAVFGAATAVADGTATITALNAQQGCTYTAYKFAEFSNPQGVTKITSIDIATTASGSFLTTITTAAQDAKNNTTVPAEYKNNVAAWIATFSASELRTFADEMKASLSEITNLNDFNKGTATNTGSSPADTAIPLTEEGWYIVVKHHTEDSAVVTDSVAVVASTINGYTTMEFDLDDGQKNVIALGQFNPKDENQPNAPNKYVYDKTMCSEDISKNTDSMDDKSVSVGTELCYVVQTNVSKAAAGYTTYPITISDTVSKGLTYNETDGAVQIKAYWGDMKSTSADDKHLIDSSAYTVTTTSNADGSTTMLVAFTDAHNWAGNQLWISYSATVNKDAGAADAVTVSNSAKVQHNGNDWSETTSTHQYVGGFSFFKYGVDNNVEAALSGAKFNVFGGTSATGTPLTFTKVDNADGTSYYYYDPAGTVTEVESDSEGNVKVYGLKGHMSTESEDDGVYTLKETAAPSGYMNVDAVKPVFTVRVDLSVTSGVVSNTLLLTSNNNGLKLASQDGTDKSIKVKNVKSLTQLPLTGGAGIILFSVIAALLIAVAAIATVRIRAVKRELQA
ncbi:MULTISPECIES: isopeptide-forming domain-containing fimbrial protein [Bifidobacterium]|jgi:fimbrial isopeptide formation D2 family protein|nr:MULTISPECIES: isopeptide-forming domain-containing fimbrial protein [Bifidobacterium]GDZ39783.1 collagen-binding protein [Bifidobacteriaceae bacterium MCC01970]ETO96024.1 fimbrial isopeptide formation D2 domain protein [Bifidobacterium sp. MSTE12]MBF9715566.1 isopeptide-forming domain-containing fimbrial protein [Bifidobacterium dentium]MDU5131338.1 isopeptide-forming domain-containing fimbrial protein [Bifidobacterium sp.]MDU5321030.1 isopeptide-forming domain-containing fimbrial protein [